MNIIDVDIKLIKPYAKNNKKHPPEQIKKIADSIKTYGFNVPILIDKDYNIIAGHGRLEALKKLDFDKAPCLLLENLNEAQIKAYRIMDNKSAESEWDLEFLKDELKDLQNIDYNMDLTGFNADELNDMFPDWQEDPAELADVEPEDAAKVETTIMRGNVIVLGNHRLMCGDSTSSEDVGILMADEKADMCFTDPPWNVNYGANKNPRWKSRTIKNDNMSTENFKDFMDNSFRCLKVFTKPGAMVYVVMSAQEWGNMMLSLKEQGFHWSSTIIWKKDSLVLSRKDYHTQYEPIWYGWNDDDSRLCPLEDRTQSDVWNIDRPKISEEHPTMKPIELCARAIKNSSKQNNIVLDLFGGSGSTLIAAEQLNRKCLMMELDPQYCEVICRRWEKLTGNKRELIL
jgi:DNA modification methylase